MNRSDHRLVRQQVAEFIASDRRVITFAFDGCRENVSRRWHGFLRCSLWALVKKTMILGITRNMSSCWLKNALLRWIGVRIGKKVFIAATAALDPQFPELISIGDNTILGMYSHIFTHEVTHTHIRLGKVDIGKNALIGAMATVRSGTRIEDNAAVGMEAFASHDVPSGTLLVGETPQRETQLDSIL